MLKTRMVTFYSETRRKKKIEIRDGYEYFERNKSFRS